MTKPLSPYELKLAALMLRKAADEFGNHGCNDFELTTEGQLSPDESFELRTAMNEWDGDEADEDIERDQHLTFDSLVMDYLAARLDGTA